MLTQPHPRGGHLHHISAVLYTQSEYNYISIGKKNRENTSSSLKSCFGAPACHGRQSRALMSHTVVFVNQFSAWQGLQTIHRGPKALQP